MALSLLLATTAAPTLHHLPFNRTEPFVTPWLKHHKPKFVANATDDDTLCDVIDPWLDPTYCSCVNKDLGGIAQCNVSLMGLDTIGIEIDLEPCADPMDFSMDITEEDLHIDYPIAGITAGTSENVPIPGLSIDIPFVGSAGVVMVIKVDGNVDQLTISFGVDACIDSPAGDECGADLPIPVGNPFPIMLIDAQMSFGNLCAKVKKQKRLA